MSTEDAALGEARTASEKINELEVDADIETRFVAMEKERNALLEKTETLEKQVAQLRRENSDKEDLLQTSTSEIKAVQMERLSDSKKVQSMEADGKTQGERVIRLEEEADRLREEIRQVYKCIHST